MIVYILSSSIQLSATGRLLDITYMCYEFRTPLFPAQLLQGRQSDLSVTSIPQSVNRWRHNEYSWCTHPLLFVQASHTCFQDGPTCLGRVIYIGLGLFFLFRIYLKVDRTLKHVLSLNHGNHVNSIGCGPITTDYILECSSLIRT